MYTGISSILAIKRRLEMEKYHIITQGRKWGKRWDKQHVEPSNM